MKAGQLTGYSLFAVKVAETGDQANRGYRAQVAGQAPGGRKITADDWDITMVALVDKPAVTKATYVIMRRAPDGQPVIEGIETPGTQGQDSQSTVQPPSAGGPGTTRPAADGDAMKNIARLLQYHEEEEASQEEQEQPNSGDGSGESAEGAGPPAAGDGDGAGQGAPATMETLVASVTESLRQELGGLKEQFQAMIDASLSPLKDAVRELETRQARFSGAGALPGSSGSGRDSDGEDEGHPLSWVNYGARPRRIETTAAANGNGHENR